MKKLPTTRKIKTVDGKEVLGFSFVKEAGVYIGLIVGPRSTKSGMWDADKKHIVRATPNLNISL